MIQNLAENALKYAPADSCVVLEVIDGVTVDEAMTAEVFTVPPDLPLVDAAREMATRWIRHLPVEDNGSLVGMVSMRDVTGIVAALAPGSVSVEHEFDQLVRERRLARIEHGDLD